MKRFAVLLLAALAVALVSVPAWADDGYTYRDGYYWRDGHAYKREQHWVAGSTYYSCGQWYQNPGHWAWKYVEYPVAHKEVYKEPAVSHKDPDWRNRLLDIAAARDKAEAETRKGAYEQKYFLDAVNALGLTGNFRWEGYGAAPPYPAGGVGLAAGYGHAGAALLPLNGLYTQSSTYQLGGYGVNASTVYGTSAKYLADAYGDTNLNQLYQQANRLAENAQKLGGQATTEFNSLVQQEGTNKARVAETIARAQALRLLAEALDGPAKTFTQTQSVEVKPAADHKADGGGEGDGRQRQAAAIRERFEASWAASCAACHTGDKAKGGFTKEVFLKMSRQERMKDVFPLLTTPDPDKLMPRAVGGGPGKRLTDDEIKAWMLL